MLLALPTNIRLGWKALPVINAMAYFTATVNNGSKMFIKLAPGAGANPIKLFMVVIYEFIKK
jgi:hypothetical protein